MIPLKLTLRNFMSYGDEPTVLPFEGLHVACLSGDNGNGKSAILDAMTWVLWGQTRMGATGSDELIRLGAEEMEVRFEFELNTERYRVIRKRKRGKTAGDWQLTQKNSKGDYVPVGGAGSRETGRQIVKLLSMEHETFINSAYLQQGRADTFTRHKANDRKRILGEILGLEQYDFLETKAKERMNRAKALAEEVSVEIRMLTGQVGRLEEYQEQATLADERVAEYEPKIAAQAKVVSEYTQQVGGLALLEREQDNAKEDRDRLSSALAKQNGERRALREHLDAMERLRAQRSAITTDYEQVQHLKREFADLAPKVQRYYQVENEHTRVVGEIAKLKVETQGQIRLLESQLKSVEKRQAELKEVEAEAEQLENALREEPTTLVQWAKAQESLKSVDEAFTQLKTRNAQLLNEKKEQEEALEVLNQTRAECPVCGSDLRDEKRERVIARQQEKYQQLLGQIAQLKQEGIDLKPQKTQAETLFQDLTRKKEGLAKQRTQLEGCTERIHRLKAEGADSTPILGELQPLRQSLQTGRFAAAKTIRQQTLEKELTPLEAAKARSEEVETQIKRRQTDVEERYRKLLQTDETFDKTVAEGNTLNQRIAETTQLLEVAEQRYQEYALGLQQANEIRRQLHLEENQLTVLQGQLQRAKADLSTYQSYIQQVEAARKELEQKEKVYSRHSQDQKHYNALAGAFGRKGIQTMIIENILPEIEDDANELLGRMTDGALKITLTTTRERKSGSGGAIETLDILVSDSMGTRPYELFSGGEGFRVNFALRLALSRLLARRSGAKLETLIMDEGFGSQDGKGRERIIEVIEAVKSDFNTILVITHFEELKDAFSQRIEIVKDANGSRIHLM